MDCSNAILTPGEEVNGWEGQAWYRPGAEWEITVSGSHCSGCVTGTARETLWNLGRTLPKAQTS